MGPVAARRPGGHLAAGAYLRVFAAASIVWFHVAPSALSSDVGAVGLGLFLYFSFMHSGLHHGVRVPLRRLARQLLIPWAAWWLFYAAIAVRLARGVPPQLSHADSGWALLNWPAAHLWYLPFVFAASMVLLVVRRILEPMRAPTKAALAILGAFGLLVMLARLGTRSVGAGIMVYAMPAAALGLAYGYCLRLENQRDRLRAFIVIALVVNAMCVPIWLAGNHSTAVGAAGSSLLMILCTLPVPRRRFVMRLSTLTLGIYVVHPFVQLVLWKFVATSSSLAFWLETFILSALSTWGMRRLRFLRRIV